MKKAVFITGSADGGGLVVARHFAAQGWNVILTSRSASEVQKSADAIAQEYGVIAKGYVLESGNEQAVIDVFKDVDSEGLFVETVVLYAAHLGFGNDPAKGMDFLTVSVEEFQCVLETNLVWNFTIVRQAALRMIKQQKGAIVFMGSNTSYRTIPNRSAYCASKGGINALSRAIAVDLGSYGIRSNVVLSGTIKTARWYGMDENIRVNGSEAPTGDISDYEDIANAVWYLGSNLSKNVTGTELIVDGGMSCQLQPRK